MPGTFGMVEGRACTGCCEAMNPNPHMLSDNQTKGRLPFGEEYERALLLAVDGLCCVESSLKSQ